MLGRGEPRLRCAVGDAECVGMMQAADWRDVSLVLGQGREDAGEFIVRPRLG